MEKNLADNLIGEYSGILIESISGSSSGACIEVNRINDLLIEVFFNYKEDRFYFKALLSDQTEGTMMIIQDMVKGSYTVSGVNGSIYKKPNVHGGYVKDENALFFHVSVSQFNTLYRDFYFKSKRVEERKSKTSEMDFLV